jgi:hypothetical protein
LCGLQENQPTPSSAVWTPFLQVPALVHYNGVPSRLAGRKASGDDTASDMKEATTSSIEAAVNRATVMRPATGNRMIDIGRVNGYDPLFRMTGPDDVINTFAARALPAQHFPHEEVPFRRIQRSSRLHVRRRSPGSTQARPHRRSREHRVLTQGLPSTRQQPEPSLPPTSRTQAATRSVNTALTPLLHGTHSPSPKHHYGMRKQH